MQSSTQFSELYDAGVDLQTANLACEFFCTDRRTRSLCRAKMVPGSELQKWESLSRVKLLGLLQCKEWFLVGDRLVLIQDSLDDYTLSKVYHFLTLEQRKQVIIQLRILLDELRLRNFPGFKLSLKSVYLSGHLVLLSVLDVCEPPFQPDLNRLGNHIELFLVGSSSENLFRDLDDSYDHLSFLACVLGVTLAEEDIEHHNSIICRLERPLFPKVKSHSIIIKTSNSDEFNPYSRLQAERELQINECLTDDSYFVTCFAYYRIKGSLYFLYEHYPCTLEQFYLVNGPYLLPELPRHAYRLSKALHALHEKRILHRDIKPSNIFLTSEDPYKAELKIGDFDKSRFMPLENESGILTHIGFTFNYSPPEQGETRYGHSSDVWQLGFLILIMANKGQYPIFKDIMVLQLENYKQIREIVSSIITTKWLCPLVQRSLEIKPEARIPLKELLLEMERHLGQNLALLSTRFQTMDQGPLTLSMPRHFRSRTAFIKPSRGAGDDTTNINQC